MANNTILHKRSSTSSSAPVTGDLSFGELAMNVYDGKLFMKRDNGGGEEIITFNSNTATATITDTIPANPASGDLWINSEDGSLLIYYDDGTSTQWIQPRTQAILDLSSIDELTDVDTTTTAKQNGDVLVWNGSDNWVNQNNLDGGSF